MRLVVYLEVPVIRSIDLLTLYSVSEFVVNNIFFIAAELYSGY